VGQGDGDTFGNGTREHARCRVYHLEGEEPRECQPDRVWSSKSFKRGINWGPRPQTEKGMSLGHDLLCYGLHEMSL